jgi:hypothetical protein
VVFWRLGSALASHRSCIEKLVAAVAEREVKATTSQRSQPSETTRQQHAACRLLKRIRMGAVAARTAEPQSVYKRRRPETTALYEIVRDNLEALYGAIDDGALDVRLPNHARKELEAFLECGLLCRGFARLYCPSCKHSQLVAFACKGRGFCRCCMGRRMSATAANLIERVPARGRPAPMGAGLPFRVAAGLLKTVRCSGRSHAYSSTAYTTSILNAQPLMAAALQHTPRPGRSRWYSELPLICGSIPIYTSCFSTGLTPSSVCQPKQGRDLCHSTHEI